jgi:hypothetical protein
MKADEARLKALEGEPVLSPQQIDSLSRLGELIADSIRRTVVEEVRAAKLEARSRGAEARSRGAEARVEAAPPAPPAPGKPR